MDNCTAKRITLTSWKVLLAMLGSAGRAAGELTHAGGSGVYSTELNMPKMPHM